MCGAPWSAREASKPGRRPTTVGTHTAIPEEEAVGKGASQKGEAAVDPAPRQPLQTSGDAPPQPTQAAVDPAPRAAETTQSAADQEMHTPRSAVKNKADEETQDVPLAQRRRIDAAMPISPTAAQAREFWQSLGPEAEAKHRKPELWQ